MPHVSRHTFEMATDWWSERRGWSNRGLGYGVAFAIGLSAVAVPLLFDAQYEEQRCSDHLMRVLERTKGLPDRPGLIDLRKKLARAVMLCSEGKTAEANLGLAEIEESLKVVARKPHG